MAGASDKARHYLEQYVPELQEYERKGIFTREEIAAITSKRSDFEHTLNARGSKPSDYAKYASYEMNLDVLRRKRSRRKGIKGKGFNSQRTVFFILERATKKFPGDTGLWMQYINFCRHEKAHKKLAKVFTNVLRLHPRDCGLWILAAKYYAEEQGDMSTARAYMQRALRFCADEKKLWLEFVRLEMSYLAKLAARRSILGLDEPTQARDSQIEDLDSDMLTLPAVTGAELQPEDAKGLEGVDIAALERIASAPIFEGRLAMVVFDGAMKQFNSNSAIAAEFFDIVAAFDDFKAVSSVLHRIMAHLSSTRPDSLETSVCAARIQLHGIGIDTAEFPAALGTVLSTLNKARDRLPVAEHAKLAEKGLCIMLPFLRDADSLDDDVLTVVRASANRFIKQMSTPSSEHRTPDYDSTLLSLIGRLKKDGREADAVACEALLASRRDTVG